MKKIFGLVGLAVLISACSGIQTSELLDGTEWELRNIRKSTPIPGRKITIKFNDGEVSGIAGCNSYFGSVEIKGDAINFGMMASTEMACMEPAGIMDQEQEYLKFLADVVIFEIADDQLILKQAVQDQLTFTRTDPD